jgi:tRNA A-37 threonylcarbamoyl transferase component Bud32
MPRMIGELDALPRGLCHGDATPDNLREPGDGTIVAIDWAYGNVGALGSDLGQLLVGRFEAGTEHGDVESIATAILEGYLEGVGDASDPTSVERAWATHLAVRSVFSALVVDHRPDLDDEGRAALVARRARVARFGIDLALRHATTSR